MILQLYRSDIWALGCVLYSLVFLSDCFDEGSSLGILSGKYHLPTEYPYSHKHLIELIVRMLVVDATKRPSINELKD